MFLLRFLLCLFVFVGALVAAGAWVFCILLMVRFPPLLLAVVLACWALSRLHKRLSPDRNDQP